MKEVDFSRQGNVKRTPEWKDPDEELASLRNFDCLVWLLL
jgi:hypothetical protein